jgi:hypothetical protein
MARNTAISATPTAINAADVNPHHNNIIEKIMPRRIITGKMRPDTRGGPAH